MKPRHSSKPALCLAVALFLAFAALVLSPSFRAGEPEAETGKTIRGSKTPRTALPETAAARPYAIVDTGQTTFYDNRTAIDPPEPGEAFYGQDAGHDGNQPDYTLSRDGFTLQDNVTGLTWTRSPDLNLDGTIDIRDKLTWSEAVAYPEILNRERFGGFDDWRLPTMKELYSLMNVSGTDPDPMSTDTGSLTPFIDTWVFDFAYGDMNAGERIIDSQFWSSNL